MNIRINLMPWRERQRASAVRRFQCGVVASLVVALLAMLLLDQMARARLARQFAALVETQAQLSALDAQLAAGAELRTERETVLAEHRALAQLRAGQSVLSDLLEGLEHSMPSGAQLTELSLEAGRLRLGGLAASPSVVAQLMRELEARGVAAGLEVVFLRQRATGDEFLLLAQVPAS
ncbi:PilN domain-containing protein [Pseudomonas farsensis]|uniref:PilN domain-containing protein n=1 Tax=Pseudomonas farsensis TaxID=2745492 RepID=A0ABU8QVH6_9PSED